MLHVHAAVAAYLSIARMLLSTLEKFGYHCRPGRLLKFALAGGSLRWQGGQPAGAALTYVGAANQRKGRADTFSKVCSGFCDLLLD